jgi:hypothetical protein
MALTRGALGLHGSHEPPQVPLRAAVAADFEDPQQCRSPHTNPPREGGEGAAALDPAGGGAETFIGDHCVRNGRGIDETGGRAGGGDPWWDLSVSERESARQGKKDKEEGRYLVETENQ